MPYLSIFQIQLSKKVKDPDACLSITFLQKLFPVPCVLCQCYCKMNFQVMSCVLYSKLTFLSKQRNQSVWFFTLLIIKMPCCFVGWPFPLFNLSCLTLLNGEKLQFKVHLCLFTMLNTFSFIRHFFLVHNRIKHCYNDKQNFLQVSLMLFYVRFKITCRHCWTVHCACCYSCLLNGRLLSLLVLGILRLVMYTVI